MGCYNQLVNDCAQWSSRDSPVETVTHHRTAVHRLEPMLMPKRSKSAPPHFVNEPMRSIELNDFRNETASKSKMPRLKYYYVAVLEQPRCTARINSTLVSKGRRFAMHLDTPSQVEAPFQGSVDHRVEVQRAHIRSNDLRLSGRPPPWFT